MKKIGFLSFCGVALMAMFLLTACGGDSAKQNVYLKKVAAYEAATEKIVNATDENALNEINSALESEIAEINSASVEEYERIFEEKMNNAEAYKADTEALEKAQDAYDNAYIEKHLSFKNL